MQTKPSGVSAGLSKKFIKSKAAKNIILYFMVLAGIVACGGSGENNGGGRNIQPETVTTLSPLKISILDLNNNPIPYVDISKIGSHTLYKLKFININSVAINLSNVGNTPDYYYAALAQSMGASTESYIANYAPGSVYGHFTKTSNTDDCLNQMQTTSSGISATRLESVNSCSYYMYAANGGNNYTTKDTFSQPVSYFISTDKFPENKYLTLSVVQCSSTGSAISPGYNCSNMFAPGFSDQFITYKMLPINGVTNVMLFNAYGDTLSRDGNWLWNCTISTCNKYALNSNGTANTLTQTSISTIEINSGGQNIETLYSAIDGSNVWVSSYSNKNGYYLVNTAKPNTLLTSDCGGKRPCVPNINTSSNLFPNGVVGLDGSFWWNTGSDTNADVYDVKNQTFIQSNIPGVVGVNADGTVIGFSVGTPGCWIVGSNESSYIYRGPLLNYIAPDTGTNVQNGKENVYLLMAVPGVIGGQALTAYYKIHTENGLCQINLDDYTYWVSQTNNYSLGAGSLNNQFSVTSISNTYSGL